MAVELRFLDMTPDGGRVALMWGKSIDSGSSFKATEARSPRIFFYA